MLKIIDQPPDIDMFTRLEQKNNMHDSKRVAVITSSWNLHAKKAELC